MSKAKEQAEAPQETSAKEAIYILIGEMVQNKTGKRIGKTGGREIFDTVVSEIFAAAAREQALRFNGGFGSLHVKTYGAGSRRLPSGQETTFGERQKVRYEEGVVVKALIANGGNLVEALKVRGTRARPEKEKPTAAEPAPAAEEKPAAEGDDLDLD